MANRYKARFLSEAIAASAAGILGLITIFWSDWIEAIFGVDPDQGNGNLEWLVVAALLIIAATLGLLARFEARRLRPAAG
jgi:hypothetical protein